MTRDWSNGASGDGRIFELDADQGTYDGRNLSVADIPGWTNLITLFARFS